jgi:gluconate 2-dehydrogenase gamma chain
MPSQYRRSTFLKSAGAAAAAAAGLAACGTAADDETETQLATDTNATQFPPITPSQAPLSCAIRSFFTPDEARAVDAITARLIPGTPDDPGALEACVPTYIDQKLATYDSFATPTYFQAPFAKPVDGVVPDDQIDPTTILVAKDQLERYGFQSALTPQQAYRNGLAQLDADTRAKHGKVFADLDAAAQDAILTDLEAGKPATMKEPAAAAFFKLLQSDTNDGMFADPIYGGNRDLAGWRLIGYPGAQRGWTPQELKHGPRNRRVQSLKDMPGMHPGQPAPDVILPISGTRRTAR